MLSLFPTTWAAAGTFSPIAAALSAVTGPAASTLAAVDNGFVSIVPTDAGGWGAALAQLGAAIPITPISPVAPNPDGTVPASFLYTPLLADLGIGAAIQGMVSQSPGVVNFDPSLLPQAQVLQMPREMLSPVMEIPVTMPDGSAANVTTPAIEVPPENFDGREIGWPPPDIAAYNAYQIAQGNNAAVINSDGTAVVAVALPAGSEINLASMPSGFSLAKLSKAQKWLFGGIGVITVLSIGNALTKKRRG